MQSNEEFDTFVDLQYGDTDITSYPIEDILAIKVDRLCTKKPMLQKLD